MSTSGTRSASQRDHTDRKRADAHAEKILSMLIAAGSLGCTNSQLWTVCHPVNSRISDLRRRGHEIAATSEGRGIWRYRLIPPQSGQSVLFEQRRRDEEARETPLFAETRP